MKFARFYPILDTDTLTRRHIPLSLAADAILQAGAEILQLRHKGRWTREIFAEAEQIHLQCTARNVPFVVNDRADMALLLRAGLHVGQDDLTPAEVLRASAELTPPAPLGRSSHNLLQLEAASREPVDYIALGPIFSTSSKANPDPAVGLDRLRSWCALAPQPLVAIGGITRANARAVLDAGADAVAVIADLYPDGECTEASLRERMEQWLQLTRM